MYLKVSFLVAGRVQGVCFRAYTQEAAGTRDVTGWVRNRADGRVEGEAWGVEEKLNRFVEWLHRGPPHARVEQVEIVRREEAATRPLSFEIRY